MTDEQKAAYVVAQAAAATAEIEGMKVENQHRLNCGEHLLYGAAAFEDVINRYGLHHNALISLFQSC